MRRGRKISASLPETRALFEEIKCGKLYALERRLKDPDALFETSGGREALLLAVCESGFHSLLELILSVSLWSEHALAAALSQSIENKRPDLAELLISSGASMRSVEFKRICSTMDVWLMCKFLVEGGDPGKGNAFAWALSNHKARPLLRFYREMRAEYPVLDKQAALALHQAIADQSPRWTALLLWAGADPLMRVPFNGLDGDWDDEDMLTTPANDACWADDASYLRSMRIKPTKDQVWDLCRSITFRPTVEKLELILKSCSKADLNPGENASCPALEALIAEHSVSALYSSWNQTQEMHDKHRLACIEHLLDRGARWNPSDATIPEARRCISSHRALYVVSIVRLLLYTPGAAPFEKIWELCRTPKVRSLILHGDTELWNDLQSRHKSA